jgi:LPS-assembly protein
VPALVPRAVARLVAALCVVRRWQRAQEPSAGTHPAAQYALAGRDHSAEVRSQLPVFVRATHHRSARRARQVEGNAELRRGDTVIRADRMEYTVPDDLATATGGCASTARAMCTRAQLQLRVDAFEGFFTDTRYQLLANGAHGDARAWISSTATAVVHQATYTTCTREESDSGARLDPARRPHRLDQAEEVGRTRRGAGVQGRAGAAGASHQLSAVGQAQVGLLPPTIGLDSTNGFEYAQPYYWNIAPNRDATCRRP